MYMIKKYSVEITRSFNNENFRLVKFYYCFDVSSFFKPEPPRGSFWTKLSEKRLFYPHTAAPCPSKQQRKTHQNPKKILPTGSPVRDGYWNEIKSRRKRKLIARMCVQFVTRIKSPRIHSNPTAPQIFNYRRLRPSICVFQNVNHGSRRCKSAVL